MAQPLAIAKGASTPEKSTDWPVRSFLPPVASINPKVTAEALNRSISLEPVALSAVSTPVVTLSPKVKTLTIKAQQLLEKQSENSVQSFQKQIGEADLEILWNATVEKNPVIQFALQKMAVPTDLRQKKSSQFLSKTLNVLISGAAMGSTILPGGGAYRNMGTMAASNALQNVISDPNQKMMGNLTATEQIQLAGLIDVLKQELITNYQGYKNTLQELLKRHSETVENNTLYSASLSSSNPVAIVASGMTYYQSLLQETEQRQAAQLFRLKLERLAGQQAVSQLSLSISTHDLIVEEPASSLTKEETKTASVVSGIETTLVSPQKTIDTVTQSKKIAPQKKEELIGPELPAMLEIGPKLSEFQQDDQQPSWYHVDTSFVGPLPDRPDKKAPSSFMQEPTPIPDKIHPGRVF